MIRLENRYGKPLRLSDSAETSPEGPLPTTAIFFPLRVFGITGCTNPAAKAFSMIIFSHWRIITASSLTPQQQDPSQSAGQTLQVNSGKKLVRESIS